MIKTDTLFILGAGAHVPYGMPLGSELARRIVSELPSKLPDFNALGPPKLNTFSLLYTQLHHASGQTLVPQLVEFRNRLEFAGQQSIDDFLRTHANTAGFPDIGRLAIAYLLKQSEFTHDFGRSNTSAAGDWLTELFNLMHRGCDGTVEDFLKQNHVSFVTFNYDRTLEHFFFLKLRYTYNLTVDEALQALSKIEIKHVYGSLGQYDPEHVFNSDLSNEDYKNAAAGIRLMHDVRQQETDDIIRAKQLYYDHGHNIIFLGFAFDEQNIKTMGLNRFRSGMTLQGTRFKMAEAAWRHAVASMGPARFESDHMPKPEWDCLDFIQNVYLE